MVLSSAFKKQMRADHSGQTQLKENHRATY